MARSMYAAALAIKFDIPIVPLAMSGGHDAMPVGSLLPSPNRPPVNMFIGEPMKAREAESVDDFMSRVRRHIIDMLDQGTANPELPDS